MVRSDFLLVLASSAVLGPKRFGAQYIAPTQHDLQSYLNDLRHARPSIASGTLIRFDPGNANIEWTEWPSLLERPSKGCMKHGAVTTDHVLLAGLVHTILASSFYPSREEAPDSRWGVIFKDRHGKRLWAIYLAGARYGMMPNSQSFDLGDASIHDWLMTHFGEQLKETCPDHLQ